MPLYQYEAFSKRGNKVVGTIDAVSMQAAKEMLQGQGLMPVNDSGVITPTSALTDNNNELTMRFDFQATAKDQITATIGGERKSFRSTADARRAGIAFVPESRRAMLFHQEPVYKNISISILDRISSLFLKPSRERTIATRQVEQLQIRPAAVELDLGMLSGGNQQKVALAKWLSYPPRVLVLCEPTRGMDVGAKNDVIHIIRDLRARGLAIIVLSAEPETVLSLSDRVIVLKRGAVVREFGNEQISKDRLLEAA